MLILERSINEVSDLLKEKCNSPLEIESIFGQNPVYKMTFDFDQYILSKQAKPFQKNGILEVSAFLRIANFSDKKTKLECSIRYTDLSVFLIVIVNLFLSMPPLFMDHFRIFGNQLEIKDMSHKMTVILIMLIISNLSIWFSFYLKKNGLQKILEQIVSTIEKDAPNSPYKK